MEATVPPPSRACEAQGSFTSVAGCAGLAAGGEGSDRMSAASDPVVIVSAARTAIGECPAPQQVRKDPGSRNGEGAAGPTLPSPKPRASPAAPPLVLRLGPRSRATALPARRLAGFRKRSLSRSLIGPLGEAPSVTL